MAALGNPPDNARHLGNGGQRGGIARAPAREGPYPERKATRYSTNFIGMKSTPDRPPTTTTHDEPASVTCKLN